MLIIFFFYYPFHLWTYYSFSIPKSQFFWFFRNKSFNYYDLLNFIIFSSLYHFRTKFVSLFEPFFKHFYKLQTNILQKNISQIQIFLSFGKQDTKNKGHDTKFTFYRILHCFKPFFSKFTTYQLQTRLKIIMIFFAFLTFFIKSIFSKKSILQHYSRHSNATVSTWVVYSTVGIILNIVYGTVDRFILIFSLIIYSFYQQLLKIFSRIYIFYFSINFYRKYIIN